jgi:SAM-dependent methyltransferase
MLPRARHTDTAAAAQDTAFGADYQDHAHMQQSFNTRYLQTLLEKICDKYPNKSTPLKLLDIGCGDGKTTRALFGALSALGYRRIEIKGIDISAEQIRVAQAQPFSPAKLNFEVCDAAQLEAQNEYDIVFSFFTFHWIQDKPDLSRRISDALKDKGFLFYLTVTRLEEWLAIRKDLLSTLAAEPEWMGYFADCDITPFAMAPEVNDAFSPRFEGDFEAQCEPLEYSSEDFKTFIKSWLPEIRHLKSKISDDPDLQKRKVDAFLTRLLALIPEGPSGGRTLYQADGKVYFPQHYATFFGDKKTVAAASSAGEVAEEQTAAGQQVFGGGAQEP